MARPNESGMDYNKFKRPFPGLRANGRAARLIPIIAQFEKILRLLKGDNNMTK